MIMENCVPTIASDEICIPNQSTSIRQKENKENTNMKIKQIIQKIFRV